MAYMYCEACGEIIEEECGYSNPQDGLCEQCNNPQLDSLSEIATNEQLREIIYKLDDLQSLLVNALSEDDFYETYSPLSDLRNRASAILARREKRMMEKNLVETGE